MKYRKILMTGCMMIMIAAKGFTQAVPKGLELLELEKIAEIARNVPDLSFNMVYTYADSAQPGTTLDSLNGSVKIHYGKYWAMIDSVEYIQNSYSMAIFHRDSAITVSSRPENPTIIQMPLLDSSFRDQYVQDMNVSQLNDTTRSFTVTFKPGMQYRSYEMQYDSRSYVVKKVKYNILDAINIDNSNSSGVGIITVTFSNWSVSPIADEYFREDKFIYRQGQQILAQPAYTSYRLVVNTVN